MDAFIGRKDELKKLQDLSHFRRACLVVIKGRRRIGKSRLVEEFAKKTGNRFFSFTGIAPVENVDAQSQRDTFAYQLTKNIGVPPMTFTDWHYAFDYLTHYLTDQPTVILFDEISWMGDKDATFVPKLKVWWDLTLQKYPKLILIFCGSVSIWIEKNIINSTAFFGRITLQIELEELSLPESTKLLRQSGFKYSTYDTFKTLAITGGVPWYLEQILPSMIPDDNIKRLCFTKGGLLVTEFDKIFHDLFNGHGSIYKKIVSVLADGMKDLSEIRDALDYPQSGSLSTIIKSLISAGYVTQHHSWSLKTGDVGKQSLYRLSDNYVRFFIKYIEPRLIKINKNGFKDVLMQNIVALDTIMGFQVENLLLNNRSALLKTIGIDPADIVADNPYAQRATKRQKGCQIDYLVQTVTKNFFVCEFKFHRNQLGTEIIGEVQEKIDKLAAPTGFGVVPVLFHLSGVSDAVYDKQYFYRIIDIADFLES